MKALVLFSGGLDSTTALALAVKKYGHENVIALSIYYGQKHDKEIEQAKKIVHYYGVWHKTMDLSEIFRGSNCSLLKASTEEIPKKTYADQLETSFGSPVSTYVPFRNGLFLAAAASIGLSLGCSVVYYAIHRDDAAGNAYPDCSKQFHIYMCMAIEAGTRKQITLEAPFVDCTKADIVQQGLELAVPYELTWSCYEGNEKPCGVCGTCRDRLKAFELNGVSDPLEY